MLSSLRAFARSQGVTLPAVQRAIKTGRLTPASVGKDEHGRWTILDATKAAEEWAAHTRVRVDSRKGANGADPSKLAQATLRERNARAEMAEIANDVKKGILAPVRDMELTWSGIVVAARTKLLGLPSRFKQRSPHQAVADLTILEALIREALEELAVEPLANGERNSS